MIRRGFTVIEMSIVLIIFGVLVSIAIAFFLPSAQNTQRIRNAEDMQLAVQHIVEFTQKHGYELPAVAAGGFLPNITDRNGKHFFYKTFYDNNTPTRNVCAADFQADMKAFIIDNGVDNITIMAPQLQSLVRCPAPKIIPKELPVYSTTKNINITFTTDIGANVLWCVTAPLPLAKGGPHVNNKSFIVPDPSGTGKDCFTGANLVPHTVSNPDVVLSRNITVQFLAYTIPAGIYDFSVVIGTLPTVANRIDVRNYKLVVNPN